MPWTDCVLDVSHNNGPIDWAHVGLEIVMVFVKASQGAHFRDPQFSRNRDGLLATGRICVPYHFIGPEDPDEQIANFEPLLTKGQPFMLDWEGDPANTLAGEDVEYFGQQLVADMGLADVNSEEVLYAGITGSRPDKFTAAMQGWTAMRPRYRVPNAASFADVPASVIAQAPSLLGTPLPRFWQYTEHGRVAGITVDIDRSVFFGTPEELRALYQKTASD